MRVCGCVLQVPNSADEGGVDDGLLGGGQDVS